MEEEKMKEIMKHLSEVEGRKFEIYCKDEDGDGEGYCLYFKVNGVIKDKKECGCFDNVLIDVYDFYYNNLEEYRYDMRFDSLIVNIGMKWFI